MGSRLALAMFVSAIALTGTPGAHATSLTTGGFGVKSSAASRTDSVKTGSSVAGRSKNLSSAHALSSSTASATNTETPILVAASDKPPRGRRLSANRVLEIANALPKMRAVRARYRGSYSGAYLKGREHWQVSYFSKQAKEIGQVIIADDSGRVLEQWTGFQIAWSMARGYPGAFGRHVNALYIWIPLCVLFFLPFFDWRKPLRLLHLDLLVLLSFSVSLAFFNHGRIYASTPLVYPPLLYLLVRLFLLARIGRRPGSSSGERRPSEDSPPSGDGLPSEDESSRGGRPLRTLVPVPWLAVGVVFLIGFRIGLNVTDSNVIDVGYAGVIGAQRIADGKPLYGGYPANNEHGDTYGPVNYEIYVPFQQVFGWSGNWDDLPAAHAVAILFDLLAVALLFLLGRRVRGPGLGIVLAYAWVSYPFTLFALESNSNDSVVAVLVLTALLAASSAPARGMLAALAGLTKFAPLALAPLLCAHGLVGRSGRRRVSAICMFTLAFVLTAAIVSLPAFTHDSLHTIYERTLSYQSSRESPFSIWGLYQGHVVAYGQAVVQGVSLALAVSLAILPRRTDLVGLAASAAVVLIAVQLGVDHWFYLYIPWFFGLACLAVFGQLSEPDSDVPVVPSESARSSPLAVV